MILWYGTRSGNDFRNECRLQNQQKRAFIISLLRIKRGRKYTKGERRNEAKGTKKRRKE
jgi:hypothetical protein